MSDTEPGSRRSLRRADPGPAGSDCLPERLPEGLVRGLGDVVVVDAGRLDVDGAPGFDRKTFECVSQERHGQRAHPFAGEPQCDLGVRAAHEVDRGGGPRLVHRQDGEPYRVTPSRAPSASESARPSAAWTSSTV